MRLSRSKVSLAATVAVALAAPVALAVTLFPDVANTFGPAGVAETAGYYGASGGTQAAQFSYPGAQVSLDASGISGSPLVVNLPQAGATVDGIPGLVPPPSGVVLEMTQVKDGSTVHTASLRRATSVALAAAIPPEAASAAHRSGATS